MSDHRDLTLPDRHPYEIYLTLFVLATSLPSALGITPLAPSIRGVLDPWVGRTWVIILSISAGLVLIGISWRRPRGSNRVSVTGVLIEQVGLVAIAMGSAIYTYSAFHLAGLAALTQVGYVAGYGIASASLALRIQKVIRGLRVEADL